MQNLDVIDKNIRILVVDDHQVTRNMVKAILKGVGYEHVYQAESGQVAINRIFEDDIDLVICDWNMPSMSGIEVLRKVRADDRYKNLPFLMLTAEAYRENVAEAMKSGVSDYMIKPFTAEVLTDKVQKALAKKGK